MEYQEMLAFTTKIAARIGEINGVAAVGLGGSWARGDASPNSDIDLVINYHNKKRPILAELRALATELDDRHSTEPLTDYGAWGRLYNGGGWLRIEGRSVDWIYRNLETITALIEECQAGHITIEYLVTSPYGLANYFFMSYIHNTVALFDPNDELIKLKKLTEVYPPVLKQAVIRKNLWEAGLMVRMSKSSAVRGDFYYVAGSMFRAISCLVQVLYALNERYFGNEKKSVFICDSFKLSPPNFSETVKSIMANPGEQPAQLTESLEKLDQLFRVVHQLTDQPLPQYDNLVIPGMSQKIK